MALSSEAVITWHGDLIRSYAIQATSEKVTRLANETITMLREKRGEAGEGGQGGREHSGTKYYRQAGQGRIENRRGAPLREQVLDVLVVHCHLIPSARKGHYMMVVPNV